MHTFDIDICNNIIYDKEQRINHILSSLIKYMHSYSLMQQLAIQVYI